MIILIKNVALGQIAGEVHVEDESHTTAPAGHVLLSSGPEYDAYFAQVEAAEAAAQYKYNVEWPAEQALLDAATDAAKASGHAKLIALGFSKAEANAVTGWDPDDDGDGPGDGDHDGDA